MGQDALCDGVRARNHQVISRQIELLDRHRHQSEIFSKMSASQGQPLDEGGGYPSAIEEGAFFGRQKVGHAEDISFWIEVQYLLQHALRAVVARKPFVNDGDSS